MARNPPPTEKSADVPTMAEFNELKSQVDDLDQRVTALEEESEVVPPIPPNPIPPNPIPPNPIPTPGVGMQAKRIASLVELFGVNTFSSLDTNNSWGSWPADYQPDTVVKALNWMTNNSGFTFRIREYHYGNKLDMQKQWFAAVLNKLPDTQITLCPGANAKASDAETMAQLPHNWLEGLNEPNTNFGSGEVSFDVTMDIQNAAWGKRKNNNVMGPSIVAGTPHPEGWITAYCDTPENMASLNAKLDYANGHMYPPGSPDVPGTGYSVNDYVGGLWGVYGNKPVMLTEYCSLLYNSQGHKDPDAEGIRSAYYTATVLFRCAQNGTLGLWWYALFDYGTVYKCGLFPKNADNPRKDAYMLRALCSVCSDTGRDRRTFTPGKLEVKVSGGDDNTSYDLYQNSAGKFFLTLWRSLANPGGDAIPISIEVASTKLTEYNLMDCLDKTTYTPKQSTTNGKLTSQLDGSVRVIVIEV